MLVRRLRQVLRLIAVLALGLTATSVLRSIATAAHPPAGQDAVVNVQSEVYPPSIKAAMDNREPPALRRGHTRDSIPNSVTLMPVTEAPPPPASTRAKGRLQVGFSRDIPASGAASLLPAALIWDAVHGGSVTAVSVVSPGAVALRLAVAFGSLPAGTEVRFLGSGADSPVLGPVTPEQIRALTLPSEAGEPGVYWSPIVSGDTVGMEVFVPMGMEPDLSFTIPRVSHLYQPVDSVDSADKGAGSCNIDVACHSASWGTSAKAVARISFISGGGSYLCTGTLLNDGDSSTFIPYFMTADHCVSTQSEASTINSYWNYQTTTCGGVVGPYTTLFGGATLLAHGASSDFSFLRLNDPAPSSAVFEGWSSATVSAGTSMVGIHHPAGNVKKISFGVIDGIANYLGPVTGSGSFLRVHWTAGVTEGGSSGSALITGSYPNDRFVGTLTGGYSSCSLPTDSDWYGRFDLAYPSISAYLSPWKDLVANFGPGIGVWALRSTAWLQVHGWNPETIVSGDFDGNGLDDLAIDFYPYTGLWLWMNHTNWVQLHGGNPTQMAVGDLDNNGKDDLVISFPGSGIWVWKNHTTWQFLHPREALRLVVGDIDGGGDDLIADFAGFGLWTYRNDALWGQIHPYSVAALTTVDLDNNGKAEVVASFPGYGVWIFRNNLNWTFLHPYGATVFAAGQLDAGTQADLVVDFGPGIGVWVHYNSAAWTQLHSLPSQGLVVADFDADARDEIVIGFGTAGLWKNRNNVWTLLHQYPVSALVASGLH